MAFNLLTKSRRLVTSTTPITGLFRMAQFSTDFMKLEMPALSPTMSEGTIVKWNIPEGGKVSVGDSICDIQTDKATIGYESQEEGYIAKILKPDGSIIECGGLIGIMVEEEEDIATIDVASIQAAATPAPSTAVEAPPKVETVAKPEQTKAASSSEFSLDSFIDELDHQLHGGQIKVSPAAGWWMRSYLILPVEVKTFGTKGFIQKSDVLDHIEANGLVQGVRK